jgi:cytochrome c peroxidase
MPSYCLIIIVALGFRGVVRADNASIIGLFERAAAQLGQELFFDARFGSDSRIACGSCHRISNLGGAPSNRRSSLIGLGHSGVARRFQTQRRSPSLLSTFPDGREILLHADGEFATASELVRETFVGLNFGWERDSRAEAVAQFASVIRSNVGTYHRLAGLSYATLLRGADLRSPATLQLSLEFRCDVEVASDWEVLEACARLVAEYLRSLQFSRDGAGEHDGSPFDAFLERNRLPRGPGAGETQIHYSRRLGERIAGLSAPQFIQDSQRRLQEDQTRTFRFGAEELQGLQIFFRGAISPAQRGGAGNCAECHVPPTFLDRGFHNTGATQHEYDSVHGAGAFGALFIPDADARAKDPDRWFPASWQRPHAEGPFRSRPVKDNPHHVDLGVWNVYGNPDLPAPQSALERVMNPAGNFSSAEVLARAIARFKTTTLRGLSSAPPFLHSGHVDSIEGVIRFYQQMSDLARDGKMRNPPPEYFAMRISDEDVAPLAAFLRSLEEDFVTTR